MQKQNMEFVPQVICGTVSPRVLDKADRLFRNDDESVWIELIQNARRAGATRVEITITENESEDKSCTVTIHDNGSGMEDFQDLLTLGGSGWSAATEAREDPAGMGFFCLCRSEVEVSSGNQFVKISPAVFAGTAAADVTKAAEWVSGTRIRFTRCSAKDALEQALKRAAEFCPVPIMLEGTPIPQLDFLEGALHREIIDGIEVGFATNFNHRYSHYGDDNWNFYGSRLKHALKPLSGYLPPGKASPASPLSLHIRCNVLETGRVKLQLPDRRAIIEDEFFQAFQEKVRVAGYRFLLTQDHHVLPFAEWKAAKKLGVHLPEAAFLLTTWRADPQDDGIDRPFGFPESHVLPDVNDVILVAPDLDDEYTLEGALHSGATVDGILYFEEPAFAGYSWYDKLPLISQSEVFLDGIAFQQWPDPKEDRPSRIEVELTIEQQGHSPRLLRLPAVLHVRPDDGLCFVAVKNSPWDNEELAGPFSLADFLLLATFRASDDFGESDSWATQKDRYDEDIERAVNAYFRGPRGTLIAILRKSLDWEACRLAKQLNIGEIRFKGVSEQGWEVELIPAPTCTVTAQP